MKQLKKLIRSFQKFIVVYIRFLIYALIALFGVIFLFVSFFSKNNWSNVFCGVGTGLLTSLIVSIIINKENDARLKRKLEEDKRFLLNDIVYISKDVYIDIIHRINEYIMFESDTQKSIYEAYDNFKPVVEFCNRLSKVNLHEASDSQKERLETLFNIENYRIDHLISELKRLPKQEYYLNGLLTREECDALTSNDTNDKYLKYAEHINLFWNGEIIDIEKCIMFMRMTLYICAKIISAIDYSRESVKISEKNVKDNLEQRYFDEVYSLSDEYIEKQIEGMQARDEYYANHPEVLDELERQFEELENETPEDRLIKDLYYCICGFSAYSIDELLEKANANSLKMLNFILQDDIQKSISKNRKKRKAVKRKFGSNQDIMLRIDEINGKYSYVD